MSAIITSEKQQLTSILPFEATHQQLSVMADAMPQLVWIAEADGSVSYYNSRVAEFAGAEKDESGNWRWRSLLHPDDIAPTVEAWQNAIATGTTYEVLHRAQMKDGSFRWHLSRAFPQKNEAGEVVKWFGTATDIHEKTVLEQEVKQAEGRWRRAFEATQTGTWEYDPTDKTFVLSDVAREIRGLGEEGKKPFCIHRDTIHPEDIGEVTGAMDKALQSGDAGVFTTEYRIFNRQRSERRWIRSVGRVITDQEGKPRRVIGIMQDITEQKAVDEKVQYLATLLQNIYDAVIGTDNDTRITNWNTGAEKIYGWTAEEALGQNARVLLQTQFFTPADAAGFQQQYSTHGHWQGEVMQRRKDGAIITILASVAWVKDSKGKQIGGVAVNKDITKQRLADQQLKESEEEFRVLTNTIPQIVWVGNEQGQLQFLNEQWERVTGQPYEEALKSSIDMVHPDDRGLLQQQWATSQQEGLPFTFEYRVRMRQTGIYRWYSCKVQPVKDEDGAVRRWIGAASDIQHFKDASVVLEEQVQARTLELQEATAALQKQAEELRRSNEDLQQFAHVASHDLKEPLRKIRTYGSRIVDEFGDTLPERARIFLQKMENAAARMSGMIDGVLGYSMLNATEQVTEVVELDEILSTIQSDLELLFERKGAAIHCGQLPVIEGSAILIYQLFYNLIGNAMKFSREDQAPVVNISAQLKTGKEISASLVADATYVQVKVTDNGIGFHPSQAEMIFKTFTRLHARDHYEGTGLGLSLCQKIVERHHGLIYAEGHPNEGATFTVILPVRQAISVKG